MLPAFHRYPEQQDQLAKLWSSSPFLELDRQRTRAMLLHGQELDDQDFQPNKRARFHTQPAPGNVKRDGSLDQRNISRQSDSPTYARAGKENLGPFVPIAGGNSSQQQPPVALRRLDTGQESPDSAVLPLRKAKMSLPATASRSTLLLAEHNLQCQVGVQNLSSPAKCAVPVRAFFTRQCSWHSSVETAQHNCLHAHFHNSNSDSLLSKAAALASTVPSTLCQDPPVPDIPAALPKSCQPHAADLQMALQYQQPDHQLPITASTPAAFLASAKPEQIIPSSAQVTARSAQAAAKAAQVAAKPAQFTAQTSQVAAKTDSLPGNFVCLGSSDSDSASEGSDDGELAEMQTQAEQSQQAVSAWLQQHGLAGYTAAFKQAEVRPVRRMWLRLYDQHAACHALH